MTAQRFAAAGLGSIWDVLDRPEADLPLVLASMQARSRDVEDQNRRKS